MIRTIFCHYALFLLPLTAYAQVYSKSPFNSEYPELIKKANAFYDGKEYRQSAETYSSAFASNGNKGRVNDRYNAACSWALAGNIDSAFSQLIRIANAHYTDYNHLTTDPDLESLHTDARWKDVCSQVKQNKEKDEAGLDQHLVATLDTIFRNDQQYRLQINPVAEKYGRDSKEMKDLWKTINENDSIDLIKVTAIIDKYGWPGPDVVGQQGNQAVFLVIQHTDIKTQEKYLPMMREAVKNKKAAASSLALLEDRVALRQGKKQIYGSQVHGSPDGNPWLSPLEAPDNVDKRRAAVGLEPLADYLRHFNMTWNVEEYKKQLPEIEKREKGQ